MSQVGEQKPAEKIKGRVARVSMPIAEDDRTYVLFCLQGDARVFTAQSNGNQSAWSRIAMLVREGDDVEFEVHAQSRSVKTMTIKGFNEPEEK